MSDLPVLDETGEEVAEKFKSNPVLAQIESDELRVLLVALIVGYYQSELDADDTPFFISLELFSKYMGQEWGATISADAILPINEWYADECVTGCDDYVTGIWKEYENDFIIKCGELKAAEKSKTTKDEKAGQAEGSG